MAKIIQKRTKRTQKLAYILKPFVVYMLVKTVVMLVLAILIPSLPITGIAAWVEHNALQLSAVVNAMASMAAAAWFLGGANGKGCSQPDTVCNIGHHCVFCIQYTGRADHAPFRKV